MIKCPLTIPIYLILLGLIWWLFLIKRLSKRGTSGVVLKINILLFIIFVTHFSFAQVSQAPLQSFINAGGSTGTITSGVPTHFSSVGQPTVIPRPLNTSTGGGVMTANELMFLTSTTVATLPSAQPTALVFSNVTPTSFTVSFAAATGSPAGYIVLRKNLSSPVSLPAISVSYTAGNTLGDATVVYVGSATTFNESGLTPGTTYYYVVFSYNGSGATINYLTTSPLQGNQATPPLSATEPTAQPTALSFTNVLSTTLSVNWIAASGSPTGYLVLRKTASSPSDVPLDGTTYVAGTTLGASTVVYSGSAVTFDETGLLPSTEYFYDVFSYNGSGATTNYLTASPLEGSQATLAFPPTISGFDPTSGTVGTSVIISGTNFSTTAANNIVKFNGTLATVATSPVPTATSLTVAVPAGATNGKITVEVAGQLATSLADFTITTPVIIPSIADFNPKSGPIGTQVSITGSNFSTTAASNIVKFNGTLATVATSPAPTTTSLSVSVPPGATTGKISIEVGGQSSSSSTDFTVTTDISPPTFGTNSTPTTVAPGEALAITSEFQDPESEILEATIQYRSINAVSTTFTNATLAKGTGNTWTGSVPAAAIGELGVEYKFKIKNGVNLEATSSLSKATLVFETGIPFTINTSFAKAQSNYRIIAIPLEPSSSVNTVFGDEFGQYDENVWRMYHYDGSMNKLTGSSMLEAGKGYWFISTKSPNGSITSGAGSTVQATTDQPYEITLRSGWNQIGNPYNFDISWNDVRNANSGLSNKLSTVPKSYNGSIVEEDEIKKFEGAYISYTGTSGDKLKIPVAKNPNINRKRFADVRNTLSNEHWEVKFNLSNGSQHYTLGGVGMHPHASDGVDEHDDFNIPRFFEFLELKHPKQLYDMTYTKDVVATEQEHTWNFTTETNQSGESITLEWDNSYFGGGAEQLWLMDVETGAVWDMKKENKVVVDYLPIRKWRVAFGGESYVRKATLPEQSSLISVYPNPFNKEVSIEMAIVETAPVKLEVFDLNGKQVKLLVNQQMNSGRYATKWLENANVQDEVASGIYIIRFQSGGVVQYKRIVKN